MLGFVYILLCVPMFGVLSYCFVSSSYVMEARSSESQLTNVGTLNIEVVHIPTKKPALQTANDNNNNNNNKFRNDRAEPSLDIYNSLVLINFHNYRNVKGVAR